MADAKAHGRFNWEELLTLNPDAASAFYTKLFGWKTQTFPNHGNYVTFGVGEGMVGGMMTLPDDAKKMGAPPHWLSYIGSRDVDATVADAQRLGGKVMKPGLDIPDVGRIAILTDPQGAMFGVFAPSGALSPPASAKAGEYSWHELATNADCETAFGFYRELFGWHVMQRHDMGPMGTYLIFGWDNVPRGGVYKRPPEHAGMKSSWLAYVHVSDADKIAISAATSGGRILNGPMDVPGGDRIAQLADSEGIMFAVHATKAAQTSKPAPAKSPAAPAKARAAQPKAAAAAAPAPKPTAPAAPKVAAPQAPQSAALKPAVPPKAAVAKPVAQAKSAAKKAPVKSKPVQKAAKKKLAPKKPAKKKAAKRSASKALGRTARKSAKTKKKAGKGKSARKSTQRKAPARKK